MENMKKKQYNHLNQAKRDRLQALRIEGHAQEVIAEILGVDQSTISREVNRNRRKRRTKRGTKNGPYEAEVAQDKAYKRRYYAKWRWKKIDHDPRIESYVIKKIKEFWSPDAVSGRMKKDKLPFYISKTAIYEWLRSSPGNRYCIYLYTRRHERKPRKDKKAKRAIIPNRISITLRPRGSTNRTRYGHWEGDTMVSGKRTGSKAALSVIYERKARYLDIKKIKNLRPRSNKEAILEMMADKKAKSITFDNGIENRDHERLGINTYFCDPYSSWQKGGVENILRSVRRWVPKKSDIDDYSDEEIKMIVNIINHKPRKSLGYKTPYEVMIENNLFKNTNQKICT